MYVINDDQLAALGTPEKDALAGKMMLVLRGKFAQANELADAEFKESIALQIERALYYGITIERNIALYIVTAFLMGENFDTEFKAVQHFLPDPNLDETTKANALEQWCGMVFEALEMQ